MPKQLIASAFALLVLAGMPALFAGGSVVPVGTYLYADLEKVPDATGSLELRFTTPGPHRLVIAFGRKYRKDSKGREGTTEPEREAFKPFGSGDGLTVWVATAWPGGARVASGQ